MKEWIFLDYFSLRNSLHFTLINIELFWINIPSYGEGYESRYNTIFGYWRRYNLK